MIPIDAKNAADMAKAVKGGEAIAPAKTLAEALARIYADGGRYVQKTGTMQGPARYSYAKEGDFIATLRPLMEAHGVTIRPVGMEVVTNETFERKSGGTAYRVVICATFELLHSSGDRATVQAFGEGQDSGDKAFNKAMTGAMKYALRQTFCVETGDDPDDTPSATQERAAPAPATSAKVKEYTDAINAAANLTALVGVYRTFDAELKAERINAADRAAIEPLFAAAKKKFPAPAKP